MTHTFPPPPPSKNSTTPDLAANQEGESLRLLQTQAADFCHSERLRMSGSKVRRIVRDFVRSGKPLTDFEAYFLDYRDPTGETAIRNLAGAR